jgi:hypothetical protein
LLQFLFEYFDDGISQSLIEERDLGVKDNYFYPHFSSNFVNRLFFSLYCCQALKRFVLFTRELFRRAGTPSKSECIIFHEAIQLMVGSFCRRLLEISP